VAALERSTFGRANDRVRPSVAQAQTRPAVSSGSVVRVLTSFELKPLSGEKAGERMKEGVMTWHLLALHVTVKDASALS